MAVTQCVDSNASARPDLFIVVIVSNLLTHGIGFENTKVTLYIEICLTKIQ